LFWFLAHAMMAVSFCFGFSPMMEIVPN